MAKDGVICTLVIPQHLHDTYSQLLILNLRVYSSSSACILRLLLEINTEPPIRSTMWPETQPRHRELSASIHFTGLAPQVFACTQILPPLQAMASENQPYHQHHICCLSWFAPAIILPPNPYFAWAASLTQVRAPIPWSHSHAFSVGFRPF